MGHCSHYQPHKNELLNLAIVLSVGGSGKTQHYDKDKSVGFAHLLLASVTESPK